MLFSTSVSTEKVTDEKLLNNFPSELKLKHHVSWIYAE